MSVGQRIVALRKKQGLTQAALAKTAKLSASAIAMYETDRRTPDSRSITKLAAALEVSAEELSAPETAVDSTLEPGPAATDDVKVSRLTVEAPAQEQVRANTSPAVAKSAAAAANAEPNLLPDGTTQLTLTLEEARVLLFLRMNPQAMSFIQTYITAGNQRRSQLEKAWRLINEFQ